jgi:CheY-like chemotaxis protein
MVIARIPLALECPTFLVIRFQNDSYPFQRRRACAARCYHHLQAHADEPVSERQPIGQSPRILVVDDNDDNRYTLMLYLELEGYINIESAHEGEEAIARLEATPFDLVLLDVMMPKVDGYQVLAWIKDQPRLRDLPVIMISALNEVSSVVRCIELRAVDYLLKPFNPVILKARLGATLEKKRLRDEIDAHLARLEAELDAARRLQMGMVPFQPPAPSFRSTCGRAWSRRARSAAISTISSELRMASCASWLATSRAKACPQRCSWRAPRA